MTDRRIVRRGNIVLAIVLCLLSAISVFAAETETLNPPAKDPAAGAARPADRDAATHTGSYVDHVTRHYSTEGPSLSVKVPGGRLSVGLIYEHGVWLVGPTRSGIEGLPVEGSGLSFNDIGTAETGEAITSIVKDGRYAYNLPADRIRLRKEYADDGTLISRRYEYVGEQVYLHRPDMGVLTIRATDDGYRWVDKFGEWTDYDSQGRTIASGTRLGERERPLYDTEGKVTGYADRNGVQRIWIDYSGGKISAIRDAGGRQIGLSYDAEGRLQGATDVLNRSTSYGYNQDDLLSEVNKPGGRKMLIDYNQSGNVKSVLDAAGRGHYFSFDYDEQKDEYYASVESTSGLVKEYWYDEEGDTMRIDINGVTVKRIVKEDEGRTLLISDERGSTTRQDYDEWTNLTKVTYPDGSSESYEYEHAYSRRIEETDARGIVTAYEYDEQGNLLKQTEAQGTEQERVTEYGYTNGELTSITVHLEDGTAVTTMSYDADGNLSSISDPENHEIQFTDYDDMGNVLSMTDARGKSWTYVYDEAGRLESVTDPLGHSTSRAYDTAGNLASVTDPNGNSTSYEYDLSDNLLKVTNDLGSTSFVYDAGGRMIRQTDPVGRVIAYEYDDFDRQVLIRDGSGNEIRMEYDQLSASSCSSCSGGGSSQPSRIIYPTFVKEFSYDKRGRKIEERNVLDGETQTTSFNYDAAGNLTSQTDAEGHSSSYSYDALKRLSSVSDAAGTTSYSYSVLGNLTLLTDAENQSTTFKYDKNGRLAAEIRPLGQQTAYSYDPAGNLIGKKDAKQQSTTYSYDDAGRLVTLESPDTGINFSYDNAGNLTAYNDGVMSGTYTYNALNQKLTETVNYGDFSKSFSYEYAANGQKSSFTMPDGAKYEYSYGENNELRSITLPGAGQISYPSYSWTRPDAVVYPGGTRREYVYDPLMRVTQILAKDPAGNSVLDFSYTYDSIGNILSKQTENGTYNYTYDALSRLTDVQVDIPAQENEGFDYDAVGNRTAQDGVDGEWSYNANNELLAGTEPRPTAPVDFEYHYDENGNATQLVLDGAVMFTYHYNAQDRLVKVEDVNGGTIAEYAYDPFGRRLWKEVSGTKTYFFYADEGLVAEYDATGTETISYGYKPDSIWTTDPLWLKQNGEYSFYQNDHLGTPQKLVKQNGAVVWSASYTAFGQARVEVETVTSNLRFPGQYFDAETGLHYNWFRYYAPGLGRYARVDPLNLASIQLREIITNLLNSGKSLKNFPLPPISSALIFGYLSNIVSKLELFEIFEDRWIKELISDPLQLNHYIYCHGNSVTFIDPQGLRRLSDCQRALIEQFLFCIGGGLICLAEPSKITCTVAALWCLYASEKAHDYCSEPCPS